MKQESRGTLEKVILLVIFLGALIFVSVTYFKEREVAKQQSLYHQLSILRQGVNTFNIVEHKYPSNLIELAIATYKIPGKSVTYRYIEGVEVGDGDKIVDPFGNPYKYDSKNGWVRSTTSGYCDW